MAHWTRTRETFEQAARWFVGTVSQVDGRWAEHGLGEWDVRALVGHTGRALLTVEEYLDRPADEVTVTTTVGYYLATRELAAGPGVAARGRAAGTALGEDPAAEVARIADRVLDRLSTTSGSELVTTIAGGMRLADYLPTRTFELTVHTLDLAAALGLEITPPPLAARAALALVAELAVHDGTAGPLLLATTGRTALRPGFSVL